MKLILIAVGVLVVLFVIAGIAGNGGDDEVAAAGDAVE